MNKKVNVSFEGAYILQPWDFLFIAEKPRYDNICYYIKEMWDALSEQKVTLLHPPTECQMERKVCYNTNTSSAN